MMVMLERIYSASPSLLKIKLVIIVVMLLLNYICYRRAASIAFVDLVEIVHHHHWWTIIEQIVLVGVGACTSTFCLIKFLQIFLHFQMCVELNQSLPYHAN